MPSVRLPFGADDIVVADGTRADHGKPMSEADARAAFSLWGLTLGIVNDWLLACGLRPDRIDDAAVERARAARGDAGGTEARSKM